MKKTIIAFTILLSMNSVGQKTPSKNNKKNSPNEVNIEVLEEISTSSAIGGCLKPLDMAGSGGYILMGLGGSIEAVNIFNKFHFYGDFVYNYGKHNFNSYPIENRSSDVNLQKANSVETILGFTIGEKTTNDEHRITLAQRGQTDYVTDIKEKHIQTDVIRLGFRRQGQFMTGDINSGTQYNLFHNINNIVLGFNRITSIKSKYNTDKFGTTFNYDQSMWYFDAMIALPSKFGYYNYYNDNASDIAESVMFVSIDNQNVFRSSFKKMPLGLRVGYKMSSSPIKNGKIRVNYLLEAGFNSGYYQANIIGLGGLFYAKLGLGFGFLKSL